MELFLLLDAKYLFVIINFRFLYNKLPISVVVLHFLYVHFQFSVCVFFFFQSSWLVFIQYVRPGQWILVTTSKTKFRILTFALFSEHLLCCLKFKHSR